MTNTISSRPSQNLGLKNWEMSITSTSTIEQFEQNIGIQLEPQHYAKALSAAEKCENKVVKEYIFNMIFPVVRGPDQLTLVHVEDNTKMTSSEISKRAGEKKNFPIYKADGLGVTLVFHTATKEFVLTSMRSNPCLKKHKPEDGKEYPLQLNSTLSGYLPDPEMNLKEAALNQVKYKMLLDSPIMNEDCKRILEGLCKAIEKNEGWEKQVCVHTSQWKEELQDKTMCVITTVKHLSCSDKDLERIEIALEKVMEEKKEENVDARRISQYKFAELDPIIQSAQYTYQDTEVGKASKAYPFKETTALVFNDLSVAAMSFGGSFKEKEFAKIDAL